MAAETDEQARLAREVASRIQRELAEDLARARARQAGVPMQAETVVPAASLRGPAPPADATDPAVDAGAADDAPSRTEAA